MLDKNFVRENLDFVRERLGTRGGDYSLDELVAVDAEWRQVLLRSEELRRQRNEASEQIGKRRKEGEDNLKRNKIPGRDSSSPRGETKHLSSQCSEPSPRVGPGRPRRKRQCGSA